MFYPVDDVFSQKRSITGSVLNTDSLPLSGASVSIKNTTTFILTDAKGYFVISASSNDILLISYVGYIPTEITVGNRGYFTFFLEDSSIKLDEVIVTGYTTQRVKEITGSVAVVKPNDLIAVPLGQVEQMLQGRVAGLNVLSSGEPGSPSNVRLHGIGNFGDVTPLYIIDGVEGDINSINPYDIASLQVLKDAGAYSIYGVRGANGVIVITTKKGKSGKTRVTYDAYVGNTRPLKKGLDLLTPQQEADRLWAALRNSGRTDQITGNPYHPLYGGGPDPVLPDYIFAGHHIDTLYENSPYVDPADYNIDSNAGPIYQIVRFNKQGTDWFHETFKPSVSQNHSVSISGGNDKNRYLLSLDYLNQQGTLVNTYLERTTMRVNTEFSLENLRFGENLQISYRKNPNSGNSVGAELTTSPYLPVYDIMGNYSSLGDARAGPSSNPYSARALTKDDRDNNWQIFGNAYAEADLFKRFTVRTSFGGSFNFFYAYDFEHGSYEPAPIGYTNSMTERSGYSRSWTWTNTLSYAATISTNHTIKAFAGTEMKSNYNREQGGTRKGYFTNDPNYRFLSNGSPIGQTNYSVAGISRLNSFISQVDYGYKGRYFVSGTLRNDGSSIFGPENRFGWFPALGLAWRMSEEIWLNKSPWINELKLRGSWGKTGFQGNTDPFNQYTLYGGTAGDAYYDINGTNNTVVQGFRMLRIGNPRTGWQEDIVTNIGVESIFWNQKLSITADWYNKKSSGLLFQVSLPALLGDVIPPNVNVGEVRNRGIDLLIGSKGKLFKDASWDIAVTFSKYKNKVIKLNDVAYFDDNTSYPFFPVVRNEVGYPISSFFGYQIVGFWNSQEEIDAANAEAIIAAGDPNAVYQNDVKPGRFRYKDANQDSLIDDRDRVHFGNPNPDFTLGLNLGFVYKNFDFSTFFYGSFGNDLLNFLPKKKDYDTWTPQHLNARAPLVEFDHGFSTFFAPNTYPKERGRYFRNRTMILGYTFPKNGLIKIKALQLRIYIQAVNLFTLTNYSGLDPELSGTNSQYGTYGTGSSYGIDAFGNYPNNQRQWIVGINFGF